MKKYFIIIFSIFILLPIFSQDVELNRVNAKDEFKWGVRFYNQGLYEKSVFSFEKSLSFDSTDLQTHMWLGRAYYMKGDVEAALKEWSILREKEASALWLDSSMDIISAGRGVLNRLYQVQEWVPLYQKDFLRPSSILTKDDGSTLVVSFTGNNITKMNTNGAITDTYNGGAEPFNRPFDIIENNNGYIVSEFMGNKISFINDLGIKIKTINPEDSPLAGPGYLAKDNNGYFYVSDWGNKRVCKFDLEGEYILSITHQDLKGPTGIVVINDEVYIADQLNKTLMVFDNSGNYIDTVISEGLESPEGLSLKNNNVILIADTYSLKEFDINSKILTDISDLQGKASRLTKGVIDVNGNTLTSDFNLGEFYALTDLSSLYGGLYVVIDRVSNLSFPVIQAEIQVYNRLGEPVIGLDNSNFIISENNKIVGKRDVVFRGNDGADINLGLILDLDSSMSNYHNNFYDLSKTIEADLLPGDKLSLIKAGVFPTITSNAKLNLLDEVSAIKPDEFVKREGIDLSIKLAASSMLPSHSRRELILVSSGLSKDDDFIKYSLNEIRDFLINNRISLSILYVGQEKNEELDYLVGETKGISRYLFAGQGSKGMLQELRYKRSGFYVINYDSLKNIDNGEMYTTFEVEVNYIRKSGRSESGFFVPVKVVE